MVRRLERAADGTGQPWWRIPKDGIGILASLVLVI